MAKSGDGGHGCTLSKGPRLWAGGRCCTVVEVRVLSYAQGSEWMVRRQGLNRRFVDGRNLIERFARLVDAGDDYTMSIVLFLGASPWISSH
jgi:hypothetical protein